MEANPLICTAEDLAAIRERDDVLKIAAPYAARLAALEKVAEAATAILKSQDDHAMTLDVRLVLALRTFLAAVPEIKEKPDGS